MILASPFAPSSAWALLSVGHLQAVVRRRDGFLRNLLQRLDNCGDVGCRLCRSVRQVADLLGNDGKAATGIAGTRGLDRRVQRQQVRPLGDQIDRVDDAADLVGTLAHLADDAGRLRHRFAHAAESLNRALNAGAAFFRVTAGATRHLIGLLGERRD